MTTQRARLGTAGIVGSAGADIVLPACHGHHWSLRRCRGRPVVLAFYPADWEHASADQLAQYNVTLPQLSAFGAELVGISVDSVWSHHAFSRALGLRFPLLSDAHPQGRASRAYSVYQAKNGRSERALLLVDAEGIVRWRYVATDGINPGVDGILTALETLTGRVGRAGHHPP